MWLPVLNDPLEFLLIVFFLFFLFCCAVPQIHTDSTCIHDVRARVRFEENIRLRPD